VLGGKEQNAFLAKAHSGKSRGLGRAGNSEKLKLEEGGRVRESIFLITARAELERGYQKEGFEEGKIVLWKKKSVREMFPKVGTISSYIGDGDCSNRGEKDFQEKKGGVRVTERKKSDRDRGLGSR